jgi:hypothetical protein
MSKLLISAVILIGAATAVRPLDNGERARAAAEARATAAAEARVAFRYCHTQFNNALDRAA